MAERECLGIFWLMGILTDVNQENSHTDDGYMSTLLLYNLQAITKFFQKAPFLLGKNYFSSIFYYLLVFFNPLNRFQSMSFERGYIFIE